MFANGWEAINYGRWRQQWKVKAIPLDLPGPFHQGNAPRMQCQKMTWTAVFKCSLKCHLVFKCSPWFRTYCFDYLIYYWKPQTAPTWLRAVYIIIQTPVILPVAAKRPIQFFSHLGQCLPTCSNFFFFLKLTFHGIIAWSNIWN